MKRSFALLVVLLGACATPYDLLRSYDGSDAGLVVASIGMTSSNTMHYSGVEIRRRGSNDLAILRFSPRASTAFEGTPTDFTGPSGNAALVQRRLPPGEYEIFRYYSGANYGTSMVTFASPTNFTVPFTVRQGQITYLGQLAIGLNANSAYLEIADESQRDLAKLGKAALEITNEAAAFAKGVPNGVKRIN